MLRRSLIGRRDRHDDCAGSGTTECDTGTNEMSRAKPKAIDQVPVQTLRFACSCGPNGQSRTLKKVKVRVERMGQECHRWRVWGPAGADPARARDHWIVVGQPSDSDVPPEGYVLYLDEAHAPVLYDQGIASDQADDLLADGFEEVETTSSNGIRYVYYKLRLRCPHCGLDATLRPEAADRLVRDQVQAGVSTVELATVAKYASRQ